MAALVCVLWFEIFGLGFFVCVLRASFSAELRFTTFGLGSLVWDLGLESLV